MTDAFLTGVYAAVTVAAFCATLGAVVGVVGVVVNAVARLLGKDD